MGAVISILMKKAQVVMEVRAENSLLENRILDIVRQEKVETEVEDIKEEDENEDVSDGTDSAFAKSSVRDSRPQGERSVKAQPEQEPLQKKVNKPEPTIQDIEVEEVDDDIPIIDVAEEPQNNS
jgi:hypothetical protein